MVKKLGGIAIALVVALIVIALKFGGGFGLGFLSAKANAPDVGDCVMVTGTTSNPDIDTVDCDEAFYKVTADDGDCDVNEDEYTIEVTGAKAVDLCLFVNADAGDCLREDPSSPAGATRVDCKANKGQPAVVKVLSLGDSADAKCPDAQAIVDDKRHLTLCFGPNR
jgi:hypothetical protein